VGYLIDVAPHVLASVGHRRHIAWRTCSTPSRCSVADTPALNATLAGRYRVQREIGRGGMATVYLADDLRHKRGVAIKLVHPELAQAVGKERFLREIEIAAQLTHPHIVPLFDSGEVDGRLFYVMPFLDGESLRQRLDRERQLPIPDAIAIARGVASALEYAHARNVVHRDIKPENVLLYEGEALVTDFGIARAVSAAQSARITGTGLVVGTPEYMSPEQALDEGADARSDQYSLACVLFEMLAGEAPYSGATPYSILSKRLVDPVPSVRRLRSTVPLVVDRAIARALCKTPADRFSSVGAFSAELALSATTPSTGTAAAAERPRAASIAVLPFRNLSPDPENDYFADGITEDVIAHLSKIRDLTVISRSSVMQFKQRTTSVREISATLGAATLLDGSVRRAGDRVRIVAQLVDGESDRQMWAETYDRTLDDIFAIQTDVALHIAAALQAELSPDERDRVERRPTDDLQAYQLFVQGRQWHIRYTEEALHRAIEFFERALARDPSFALPAAELAMCYLELAEGGTAPTDEAYARAAEMAARALRLDPESSEAHGTMAYLHMVRDFAWRDAEREFQRALALSPSNADACDLYGRLCAARGRFDEAIEKAERAQELDPLAHRVDVATALLRGGRYAEAAERSRAALEVDPASARARATLGWAELLAGQCAEGLADLQGAVALAPGSIQWLAQLGAGFAACGEEAKARDILRDLEDRTKTTYVSPYHLAYVHTALGEHDRAIDLLTDAKRTRTGPIFGIGGSFLFAALRPHPRFKALLGEMNLR
jgi:serine/threonine protein kinase/Flp pilus assembly protein TadD